MDGDRGFRPQQRGVIIRMGLALAATLAAMAAALYAGWGDVAPDTDERLSMAGAAGFIPAFWLTATIADVARRRLLSPDGIGGGDDPALTGPQSVLRNTLEQAVLAWPVWLGVALFMDRPASLLIALGGLFSLGRLLFWTGWGRGAAARAFGFGLTFYPTVAALALASLSAAGAPW
ncbi:hypothetical protein [Brevundimonas sp.]|uniref:hypothetical protein n=1 Tax=Brevundimonas sp. TaxID=1871086 RepID=UPI002D4F844E|nr:hypothetical protein [Brevundimonas sp.]HYC98189.1 hypothetical protein [Brevundimonas sp.]